MASAPGLPRAFPATSSPSSENSSQLRLPFFSRTATSACSSNRPVRGSSKPPGRFARVSYRRLPAGGGLEALSRACLRPRYSPHGIPALNFFHRRPDALRWLRKRQCPHPEQLRPEMSRISLRSQAARSFHSRILPNSATRDASSRARYLVPTAVVAPTRMPERVKSGRIDRRRPMRLSKRSTRPQ